MHIRPLREHDEILEAVRIQKEIWNFDDIELLPARMFAVATRLGGQLFGAFAQEDAGERMAGFCVAIPGIKPDGKLFLHSHMLGVLAGFRDAGTGRALKLAQRDDALARGIDLVEWTFDPLEIKNAWFNVERLGAIIRRHIRNAYGVTSSPLHGGLPTDRCVAEWHLSSPRVLAVLAGQPPPRPPVVARVAVPDVSSSSPLREIQESVSAQFENHFRDGLYVSGLERSGRTASYLLSRESA